MGKTRIPVVRFLYYIDYLGAYVRELPNGEFRLGFPYCLPEFDVLKEGLFND